jgi:hypothetical protein
MKICDSLIGTYSFISSKASKSDNTYLYGNREVRGIGGNVILGPVRLVVTLDYQG